MTNKEKGLLMWNAERAYASGKSIKQFIMSLRSVGCEHSDSTIKKYFKIASERVEVARQKRAVEEGEK